MSTRIERQKRHRAKMQDAGFVRLWCFVHGDVVDYIDKASHPGETRARTLERLLLGVSRKRPRTTYIKDG